MSTDKVSVGRKVCVGRRNIIKSEKIGKIWHISMCQPKLPFLFSSSRIRLCSLDSFRCPYTSWWYMSLWALFMRCKKQVWGFEVISVKLYIEDPAQMLGTYPESRWLGFEVLVELIYWRSGFEVIIKVIYWRSSTDAGHLSRISVTRIWSFYQSYMLKIRHRC
jgi:hypothetical protein